MGRRSEARKRAGSALAVALLAPLISFAAAHGAVSTPPPPGAPDPSFSSDGIGAIDVGTELTALGEPSIVGRSGGKHQTLLARRDGGLLVQQLNASGAPDSSFGTAGTAAILGGDEYPAALLAEATSTIAVAAVQHDETANVRRIGTDGSLDLTFGTGGVTSLLLGPTSAANRPGGGVLVAGGALVATLGPGVVYALDADGDIDAGWGDNGRIFPGTSGRHVVVRDIVVAGDGTITVVGDAREPGGASDLFVARYASSGAPITAFSGDGVATFFGSQVFSVAGLTLGDDGSAYTAYTHGDADNPTTSVVHITSAGLVDATFGGPDGVSVVPAGATGSEPATLSRDGTALVLAGTGDASTGDERPFVAWISSAGSVTAVTAPDLSGPGHASSAVVSGGAAHVAGTTLYGTPFVVRATASGLDAAYATGGLARLGQRRTLSSIEAIDLLADGRTYLAGNVGFDGYVARMKADGTPDAAFAGIGRIRVERGLLSHIELTDVVARSDGSAYVGGIDGFNAPSRALVLHVLANGALDPAFGDGGMVRISVPGLASATRLELDAAGRIVALARQRLFRLTPAGDVDVGFGTSGFATLPNDLAAHDVAASAGRVLVVGDTGAYSEPTVVAYTAQGVADATYGDSGRKVLPVPDGGTANRIVSVANAKALVVGDAGGSSVPRVGYVGRLTSAGAVDPTFGSGGLATVLPSLYRMGTDLDAAGSYIAGGAASLTGMQAWRIGIDGQPDDRYNLAVAPSLKPFDADESGGIAVDATGRVIMATSGQLQSPGRRQAVVSRRLGGDFAAMPTASLGDATVVEGTGSSAGVGRVAVRLSGTSAVPIHASFRIGSSSDVKSTIAALTIPAGATGATLLVPVVGDQEDESDEEIVVTGSFDYAVVKRGRSTLTIVDDDGWDGVKPSVPQQVKVRPRQQAVAVQWLPPFHPGHSETIGYFVFVYQHSALVQSVRVPVDVTAVSVVGLAGGTATDVRVAAWTAAGNGPASAPVRVTPSSVGTTASVPMTPAFAGTTARAGALVASWRPPPSWPADPSDGGSPITAYQIVATDLATSAVAATREVPADVRSASLTGLTPGHSYVVSVRARNAVGLGAAATTSSSDPDGPAAARPWPPTWVAVAGSKGGITTIWGPGPEFGLPITGYRVIVARGASVVSVQDVDGNTRRVSTKGLAAGVTYDIYVVARAASGLGEFPVTPRRAAPT
jgi:uncharacterized delta-60 repeat protein